VKWNKTDGSESTCQTWVKARYFVFPKCAKEYIAALIKDTKCDDDKKSPRMWKREFERTEIDEQGKNSIEDWNDEEGSDLAEIDFCCFLCSCEGDVDGILKSLRPCEYGRKHHRACCHGYTNVEDLEGFISAAGRAVFPPVENDETSAAGRDLGTSENNETPKKMPEDNSIAEATKPSAITVCSGESVNQ
jgi:hypothetical protein